MKTPVYQRNPKSARYNRFCIVWGDGKSYSNPSKERIYETLVSFGVRNCSVGFGVAAAGCLGEAGEPPPRATSQGTPCEKPSLSSHRGVVFGPYSRLAFVG